MITKICSTCKKEKPLIEFYKHKNRKDGYRGQCKNCFKTYPEKERQRSKKWYENNREYALLMSKEYFKKHPEVNHKASKKYRDSHIEEKKIQVKKWRQNNHGKVLESTRKRRNIKRGTTGSHTFGEWELLKIQYGFTCPCCNKSEPNIKLTEDHIVPLSKGGSDYIENIQPLCGHCNFVKHTKIFFYTRKQLDN